MKKELPDDVMDFLNWFVGERDPSDSRVVLKEDRGDITYLEVAEKLRDKYRRS